MKSEWLSVPFHRVHTTVLKLERVEEDYSILIFCSKAMYNMTVLVMLLF